MTTPWSNQSQNLIILIEENTGFTGLFVYAPSPGLGNLALSIAAGTGTDPYGNTYISESVTGVPAGTDTTLIQLMGVHTLGTTAAGVVLLAS